MKTLRTWFASKCSALEDHKKLAQTVAADVRKWLSSLEAEPINQNKVEPKTVNYV